MNPEAANEVWELWRAWLWLVLGFLGVVVASSLASIADMIWFGAQSFHIFRHSPAVRPISYVGSRVLVLTGCFWLSGVGARDTWTRCLGLRNWRLNYLVIVVILGLWLATFLEFVHQGRLSNLHFQTSLSLESFALLVAPCFEEAVMRGFFYPAFRVTFGVSLSVGFAFVVDTILFHPGTLGSLEALVGSCAVNVCTSLFRERTGSLWPSIAFHIGYNLLFIFFTW